MGYSHDSEHCLHVCGMPQSCERYLRYFCERQNSLNCLCVLDTSATCRWNAQYCVHAAPEKDRTRHMFLLIQEPGAWRTLNSEFSHLGTEPKSTLSLTAGCVYAHANTFVPTRRSFEIKQLLIILWPILNGSPRLTYRCLFDAWLLRGTVGDCCMDGRGDKDPSLEYQMLQIYFLQS